MPKNITAALVGAAILAATLSGCVPTAGGSSNPDAGLSEQPQDAPSASFAPEVEEPAKSENLAFGDAMTWEDDVALSVSVPATYVPSEYAAGVDQAAQIQFNVTITNNSGENLDPSVYGVMSSGGVEANQIFDGDLNGTPSTVILPGGTITWTEAWSVADPASLIYQLAPSYDYEDAIFVLGN